jgi:orotate phosphoribosyltransferase
MVAEKIAKFLLEAGAVQLRPQQPFKWSSGWNSPIYCDNRLTLSYPKIRTEICDALTEACKLHFSHAESIAGVATAGIAQGALVADRMNLPYLYVRPKPKDHGMENLIEGKIVPGQKVVLIEDLISTGGSSLKAAEAMRQAGFEVVGMLAVFSYGFEIADAQFKAANIPLVVLSTYASLLPIAQHMRLIAPTDIDSLNEWRKNPEIWGK